MVPEMGTPGPVTDALRTDVLDGIFAPGERLVELQLTERYSCGRAAVRAALTELTSEGLIEREANRGAKVRRITVTEAVQITEARAALESLIAAKAALDATDDDRAELSDIVARMRTAVADGDGAAYSDLNRVFHRHLRNMSGHEVAAELVGNLRNRAAHHQYRLALVPGRSDESLGQHAAIAEAVVAGDADGAADAMRAHLHSVVNTLQQWSDATSP
jgi:DNA-binding GntR family transcriptional regulator